MNRIQIKPFNVIDRTHLPEISVDKIPEEGDPVEIDKVTYYVCEQDHSQNSGIQVIGVIPLVVRDPARIPDIKEYISCLSVAHRKVQFKKGNITCDLEECDEMIIS